MRGDRGGLGQKRHGVVAFWPFPTIRRFTRQSLPPTEGRSGCPECHWDLAGRLGDHMSLGFSLFSPPTRPSSFFFFSLNPRGGNTQTEPAEGNLSRRRRRALSSCGVGRPRSPPPPSHMSTVETTTQAARHGAEEKNDPRGEARQLRLAPAPRSRRRARHGSRVWPCGTRGGRGVRAVRRLSARAHGRARCALCAMVSFSFVRRRLLASFRAPAGGREARAWCVICTTRRHGTRAWKWPGRVGAKRVELAARA